MARPVLQVVIASTRPGRVGKPVGDWFAGCAREHGGFDVEVVDLKEVDLPFLDEPKHPRLRDYVHEHTHDWSATVSRADAYAFVMPEYNFGYTAPLKNALDLVLHEWAYKAVGLVSYGGASGGLRAANQIKPTLQALRMTCVYEAVAIPWVVSMVDDGVFTPTEPIASSAAPMLDELLRVTTALAPLRRPAP